MKNNIVQLAFVGIFICFWNTGVFAQEEFFKNYDNPTDGIISAYKGEFADKIDAIDKQIRDIKQDKGFTEQKSSRKDSSGFHFVYKKGDEFQIIIVINNETEIHKRVVWLFEKERMFYCEQIWTNFKTNKIVDYQKFYLEEGVLFAWFKQENQLVDNKSIEFKEMVKSLAEYSDILKKDFTN